MAAVGLVVHELRPEAADLAREAAGWLRERGHDVRLPKADAENVGLPELGCPPEELAGGLRLAVSLGGDGTMLRAVHLVSRAGVPVLGVNLGRLGYLADLEPRGVCDTLDRVLAGEHSIEERMMLSVMVQRAGDPSLLDPLGGDLWALNEAVIERPAAGHTIRVAVQLDGRFWTTYSADGLIVATPTGSTAYAFSAGGPIVAPDVRALLMTPAAAHISFARSLVVDSAVTIRIEVTDRPAALVLDGRQMAILNRGDAIICTEAPGSARFVTFGSRDFYGILKEKFGVADR